MPEAYLTVAWLGPVSSITARNPTTGPCASTHHCGTLSTMTDDLAIRVRGLRKAYGEHVAVDGLDLDVARGECFALLGPNGAGKTTTVEILEGYRKRNGGEVSVVGPVPTPATRGWRGGVGVG